MTAAVALEAKATTPPMPPTAPPAVPPPGHAARVRQVSTIAFIPCQYSAAHKHQLCTHASPRTALHLRSSPASRLPPRETHAVTTRASVLQASPPNAPTSSLS
eukprot:6200122-Pleurochrysis_carterae.AAC.3